MIICVPSAPMYREPSVRSEQVDEGLYGMECEILATVPGFHRVKMFYDYEGWVEKPYVSEELHKPNMLVTGVDFADLLPAAENRYKPIMALPAGSRVDVGFSQQFERYGFAVLPNKRIFYIHKGHISPLGDFPKEEDSLRSSILTAAEGYLGTQYRWGGKTHGGIDCSGLAFMAYYLNGVLIYRDADISRSPKVREIPFSEAKTGDLLYFPGHMAVYKGEGTFVHASASKGKVVYGSFDPKSPYYDQFLADKLTHTGTIF